MRRAGPVVLLLLVAAAAVAAGQAGEAPKPERQASCFACHDVAIGASPPITTFLNLVPAVDAGAEPGRPFDFTVQAQNAWTHEQRSVRVSLDLTAAPSLGFASGVPDVNQVVDDAIQVDPATAAGPQSKAVPVDIPVGETHMEVRLTPTGGTPADLALLAYPPGATEPQRVDAGGEGAEEVYRVEGRSEFGKLGYRDWTFAAEARLVAADGHVALPDPSGTIPFRLSVAAHAEASAERIGLLQSDELVPAGKATSLAFQLVALAPPQPGEAVTLGADAWVHYTHPPNTPDADDDEAVTKAHPAPIPVTLQAGRVTVGDGSSVVAPLPVPHNGPTMATLSEAVGYATALLMTTSVTTGGMFGKASRRGLNHLFGAAKRRVAFHNFLSYGILVAGGAHMTLFLLEGAYAWTAGMLWGGTAILALLGLGVTGALQVPMIRAWGYAAWRWTHYGLAVAALALTAAHGLLDGAHFTDVQDAVGWRDPLSGLSG